MIVHRSEGVRSDGERIAQELHRALRIVVEGRAHVGSDLRSPVRQWIDLDVERRRVAIEVVETLLANGTIAVGPGREHDAMRPLTEPSEK